ncbi:terminase small subunit [Vibrio coralliilyticus]|uniref:Terminase small subunit n=1 Tax=Vibrio coralliilyticus TaxID=190893 RepID=A0AAN0SG22_9VIBR|nr:MULTISPECIES: terminase small subunit [Vibrio]AIW21346.1 hypothetical protein IX92_20245 [Vibrio coralliilyticus]MDA0118525.1 terminase small subunit [Vibrio sp. T11.5]NOH41706.1 terminase small subunit [Vibrio coralliilyticus]NOI20833.1 terminase small subunit [Vibrio coralliilyticus]
MTTVNKTEFANILGCSAKWVGQMMKEGMPAQSNGRGKAVTIDTEIAIKWMIDRDVKKQVGQIMEEHDGPKAGTKDGEDLLLTQAKRRKADVEAKKAEERVMDLDDLAQFLYATGTLFANELNGLGARIASEVATINDPAKCKYFIDKEGRRIRTATADRISEFVADYIAANDGDGASEAFEECSELG